MGADWPVEVLEFERFLTANGLQCQVRESANPRSFGNRELRYADANIVVSIVSDRSQWIVWVGASQRQERYSVDLIRGLLQSSEERPLEPLADQIGFVRTNWDAITQLFRSERSEETHTRLMQLGSARADQRESRARQIYLQRMEKLRKIEGG
jgi:hypothetical protein